MKFHCSLQCYCSALRLLTPGKVCGDHLRKTRLELNILRKSEEQFIRHFSFLTVLFHLEIFHNIAVKSFLVLKLNLL